MYDLVSDESHLHVRFGDSHMYVQFGESHLYIYDLVSHICMNDLNSHIFDTQTTPKSEWLIPLMLNTQTTMKPVYVSVSSILGTGTTMEALHAIWFSQVLNTQTTMKSVCAIWSSQVVNTKTTMKSVFFLIQ